MPRSAKKEHPLSMRLPRRDISLIDRAAALKGRSRTDFVREAAVKAAEEVVMEALPIRMSAPAFHHLVATIEKPGKPVRELVELFKRPVPWER